MCHGRQMLKQQSQYIKQNRYENKFIHVKEKNYSFVWRYIERQNRSISQRSVTDPLVVEQVGLEFASGPDKDCKD